MLKIPIDNLAFVQFLIIWVKGQKVETAQAYPYLNGCLCFMHRHLYFLKSGAYAISEKTNAPNFANTEQNTRLTLVDDILSQTPNIDDLVSDLDFEVVEYTVRGFVELKNC